jgi:hypothetical protein
MQQMGEIKIVSSGQTIVFRRTGNIYRLSVLIGQTINFSHVQLP